VLAVAVAAVLAGAKSLAAIGEWAADAPGSVLAALGARRDPLRRVWRPPGEATVRRVLARVDPEALDQVIGRWLTEQQPPSPTTRPPPPTRVAWRQAVAVDGKTLRGSGHPNPQVHLLAAMDHATGGILGQTDVDHTTNEIARFQPLLQALDLAGRVVTADALHTQREHADWLVGVKHTAYLLVVKANSPPCTSSSRLCPGARSLSPTTPATAATAGSRPAACRSPPLPAWTSPTPPRRSASPAGSGRLPAGAGAP
jgi:DDE_Tnp_1-associated/Transposase DDE domain